MLELSVVPGEYRNDTNAPLMTIADLSTVWVTSHVPESSIRFIQVGERVEVNLVAYPGEMFHGRVSRIADTVDPQTRTIKVRAEMDNRSGRFRPEMYGSIRHTESIANDARSSRSARVHPGRRQNRWSSSRRRPGVSSRRTVDARRTAPATAAGVLSGLKAGDRVVVDGAMLLQGLAEAIVAMIAQLLRFALHQRFVDRSCWRSP